MQREADVRRSEIKDVLQALEELAITYDNKNNEFAKCSAELDQVSAELCRVKEDLETYQLEKEELKATSALLRERMRELLFGLNNELFSLGNQLNKLFAHTPPEASSSVEEQAAVLKLLVVQIKSELQSLHGVPVPEQTGGHTGDAPSWDSDMDELAGEMERKTKEFQRLLDDSKQVSQRKQDTINQLHIEVERLSQKLLKQEAYAQVLDEIHKASGISEPVLEQINLVVEKVGNQLRQKLFQTIAEADSAWAAADKVREENIMLKLQLERFVNEVNLLRRQMGCFDSSVKDRTANELKSMEEAVLNELEVLNSLRRSFIVELKDRIKKYSRTDGPTTNDEPIGTQTIGSAVQRERINFLKTSLDNLTKVHKQLVRDNADLRCDIPKLEKRVKASMERIKDLEVALRESKEQMIRDRRRYHQDLERLKEANWARGNAKVLTNIIKPIRPGTQKDAA